MCKLRQHAAIVLICLALDQINQISKERKKQHRIICFNRFIHLHHQLKTNCHHKLVFFPLHETSSKHWLGISAVRLLFSKAAGRCYSTGSTSRFHPAPNLFQCLSYTPLLKYLQRLKIISPSLGNACLQQSLTFIIHWENKLSRL